MEQTTISTQIITLEASEGNVLTNGEQYARYVACPTPEDAARWREVPESEASLPPEPDTAERDAAERAIVQAIVGLAQKYGALQDLALIPEITIPALQALAQDKGVTLADWNDLIAAITPYKWQLEAVVGETWQDCWAGLKSRFRSYMAELLQS